eukprot:CAMPEP_0183776504 /NCGR_PEP_ID=MMETSP0739-20130205/47031_1 /TAXON_ID=385413 /ORGANISM="Thalassiosira miniscula, Strain CCMP1093" /LENGTH=51 /DNA_ID=CAMNT_0026018381 /DNA_START=110 /DNA_END=262 /DNA_ORIENTATION=+
MSSDVLHEFGMVPPDAAEVDLLRLANYLFEQRINRSNGHIEGGPVIFQSFS